MYGLIGHPLGHSMSPFIHKRLFELSELDEDYELFDIAPENLTEDFASVMEKCNGINVTIPHKQAVLPLVSDLDGSAARYNSVNCIAKKDGKLTGYNTDCIGFLRSVPEQALSGEVLLLGCGGVGRMMGLEAAAHGGKLTIAVLEEFMTAADKLAKEIKEKFPDSSVKTTLLSTIDGDFDLLINATPVGMFPKVEGCPVDESVISRCINVFDAVYNPIETKLIKTAKKLGKNAVGGMAMLVLQAVAAHEIWYGGSFSQEQVEKLIQDTAKQLEQ